ncbi:U3 small nucleolar RNA-associated protein 5 [Trichomonascus vanleenenianus]|uniref:Utp5p n=1 Tax=Trichomonascus vanleenenianus TaxID=2268995 RepID=UPI003ECA0D17
MEAVPLVASSFDPSGQLYASAIPSLDLYKVRVHSVGSEQTVQSDFVLDKGVSVTSLGWSYCSSSRTKQQKKKRKRSLGKAGSVDEDLVVVVGTNTGSVILYSPVQNAIIERIVDVHSVPVTSVSYDGADHLWSCDYSGVISSFDVAAKTTDKKFSSPKGDVRTVKTGISSKEFPEHVLVASSSVYLVDPADSGSVKKTFPGFTSPVSTIIPSSANPDLFLAASQSERNININSLSQGKSVGVLIAQSDVQVVALSEDESALAVITDDGSVEIFTNPFEVKGVGKSTRRKSMTSSKSTLQIKVSRPKGGSQVRIDNAVFRGDQIMLTWLESAIVPVFEFIQWKEEGTAKSGLIELAKERRNLTAAAGDRLVNGVDPAAVTQYNEGKTVVTSGRDVQNLDSDEEEEEEEEDEEAQGTLAERLEALEVNKKGATPNKKASVATIQATTPGTFTVILNQALKTNDQALLESCLVHRDEEIIKLSVQRLESSLAVKLLEKVAEKIAQTPTQAGRLNVWIKWVMIAHGGYLVTIPNLLKTLSSLHSTLSNRVSTLPRLLALQGRLEMLNSQMELRREILSNSKQAEAEEEDEDEDEDEVTYVEEGALMVNGEEDDDSEEDSDVEDEDEEMADGFIDLEAEDDAGDSDEDRFSDMDITAEPSDSEEEATPRKLNGKAKRK